MNKGKLAAPIVVGVLVIAFFCWCIVHFAADGEMPLQIRLVGVLIPLALIGVTAFVMLQRIKEIRSGEEDDLSQY